MQAAGIAAILPNPRKFKASNSTAFINRRKERIVRVMRHIGTINY
jgi:monofunctional biosynthetic peptidoglycan transglycosylase